jgi:hypothetical protein
MIYFNACIQDWWGSAGFGGRRFDGTIPIFCLGLGALAEAVAAFVQRRPRAAVLAAGSVLALWNLALMGAAQTGLVRTEDTLPFDRAWSAQTTILHRWFGNPFTYPASLVFAVRNRVSPGDYDLLSTNRFLADPLHRYGTIDVGGNDQWLIGEGWHAPERDGAISFRWATDAAQLRVPLDHGAALRVQVRLHALAFPGAPPQAIVAAVGGRSCEPLPVGGNWATVECVLEKDAWRSGVNQLTLRFAWAHRPQEVGLGDDPRLLAAAVDFVRVLEQEEE